MTTTEHWMARQGDVVATTHVYNDNDELVPVQPPTSDATDVPRDPDLGVVLQAGAVTGHHHHMPGAGAALLRELDGARKLVVADVEPLDHDEHDTVEIPAGVVAVGIQVEHVPGELPRQVED
jgi:hypothetical protein